MFRLLVFTRSWCSMRHLNPFPLFQRPGLSLFCASLSPSSRPFGARRIHIHVHRAAVESMTLFVCRALALVWDEKAQTVVHKATWISAGGQTIEVPSVVSLRRYVKVTSRCPPLNRRTILMRDLGMCQYCDATADNIDHVIPRSKGGGTSWENCVVMHHAPVVVCACFLACQCLVQRRFRGIRERLLKQWQPDVFSSGNLMPVLARNNAWNSRTLAGFMHLWLVRSLCEWLHASVAFAMHAVACISLVWLHASRVCEAS
jgi:hypothetical protein